MNCVLEPLIGSENIIVNSPELRSNTGKARNLGGVTSCTSELTCTDGVASDWSCILLRARPCAKLP